MLIVVKWTRNPNFTSRIIFQNDPDNLAAYFQDAYSLIVIEADRNRIEFDGYLAEKWEESEDSIFYFDEEYFEDCNRKNFMSICHRYMMRRFFRICVMHML